MSPLLLWSGLVPVGGLTLWWLLRRLEVRHPAPDVARALFRRDREHLEARFLTALARTDPDAARRWDDARWRDEVVWARDRRTRRLLALVGVRFDDPTGPDDDVDDDRLPTLPSASSPSDPARDATALFEFRDGRWRADGLHIDALGPLETLIRHRQLEPLIPPGPRA